MIFFKLGNHENRQMESHEDRNRQNPNSKSHAWADSVLARSQNDPTQVSDADKQWLEQLEYLWHETQKNQHEMQRQSKHCFDSATNPYALVIFLVENSREYVSPKSTTLSYFIIKEFERWSRENSQKFVQVLISEHLKICAFQMATRFHTTLLDPTVKAYQLAHEENEYFLPQLKQLLTNKKYKFVRIFVPS